MQVMGTFMAFNAGNFDKESY